MSETRPLPVVGAAMRISELPEHIEWLTDKQRDLELQDPAYIGVLDEDWKSMAAESKRILSAHGYSGRLGIHGAYQGLDISTHDKLVQQLVQTRYRQSLEFGAEIGATHMVIHSPFIGFGNPHIHFMLRSERQTIIDAAHAVLEPLLPMAEQMQCAFVIEVCNDLNTAPLLDLVRSFSSPLVRLSIDAGHAFVMQHKGGPTPDQWVYEGADVLGHLHLQDVDGQADRHWTLGVGSVNWRALFQALGEVNVNPRLILEIKDVRTSARYLEQLGLVQ